MIKIGLVLSGGGGKGAYQIGVWRALEEFGIVKHISVVAGTSVGALNMALFAQQDYAVAEDVWLHINQRDILSSDANGWFGKLTTEFTHAVLPEMLSHLPFPEIVQRAYRFLNTHGIWDRAGLLRLMERCVDFTTVANSALTLYATCTDVTGIPAKAAAVLMSYAFGKPLGDVCYMRLNRRSPAFIQQVVLASSALPLIFPPEQIEQRLYYDGGLLDNDPVTPVYEAGCHLIIVVQLDPTTILAKERFPHAQIVEILPQADQGGLISGTLDFTATGSQRRIMQGYHDARRILEPILAMAITQKKFVQSVESLKEEEVMFQHTRSRLLNERQILKDALSHARRNGGQFR